MFVTMLVTVRSRLVLTLAAATSLVLTSGCTAISSAHPAPAVGRGAWPTANFTAMGLSFRYPAVWRSGTWNDDVSSFTALIVDLSTASLHDPCAVTTSPVEQSVTCGYPVGKLPPGGILVSWDADGFPSWHSPKPNTTIAGRRAVETRTTGGWCSSLGGTETITVIIPRDATDNWYQMDACLRAPGLPQQEAQVSAMLRTVQIAKGY
jgi:hypothetical protein